MLGGEPGSGTGRLLTEYFGELGVPRSGMQLGSTEAIKQAVRAGLGVSLVMASAVQDEVRSGALVALPIPGLEKRLQLIWRKPPGNLHPPGFVALIGRLATTVQASHSCPPTRGGLAMNIIATCSRQPWNKGKLVGQKTPLRLRDIWAIRVRLQIAERTRDLALFDLAIDSKLRACDLTKLRVRDVAHGEQVSSRAIVMQQKTQRPVQFEITEQTRAALAAWIHQVQLRGEDYLFPSRLHNSDHLSTRQYARIVKGWVKAIGLDPAMYGTHTMRRTKASLIYRRTKNLRAVQLLLGHTKLESTVRYLGIEVDDALEMAEQTEV
ncbi:Tyrosine recombinase XerC [Pseudomonas aeruginosa]|nr:Tyrosine recombinase XerC [Pseudomonas aeruginosa]